MESKSKSSRKEKTMINTRRSSCSSAGTVPSNSSKNSFTSTLKQSPPFASSTPTSAQTTPKKALQKKENTNSLESSSPRSDYEFLISGSPAPRISNRANSLPSSCTKRPPSDVVLVRKVIKPVRNKMSVPLPKGRISVREDEMSLDLSIASDFDEVNSQQCDPLMIQRFALPQSTYRKKCINRRKELSSSTISRYSESEISEQATKKSSPQSYIAITQSVVFSNRTDSKICEEILSMRSSKDLGSRKSTNRDIDLAPPEEPNLEILRGDTLGQSCNDESPRDSSVIYMDTLVLSGSDNSTLQSDVAVSPFSQRSEFSDVTLPTSSSSSIEDTQRSTEDSSKITTNREEHDKKPGIKFQDLGEWNNFWANYNNSLISTPDNKFYDECSTHYNNDLSDNDVRKPENISITKVSKPLSSTQFLKKYDSKETKDLDKAVGNYGLYLTADEAEEILYCAQTLTKVISSALQRVSLDDEEKMGKDNGGQNTL